MYTKKITKKIFKIKDKDAFYNLKDMFTRAYMIDDYSLYSKEYFKIQEQYFSVLEKSLTTKKVKTDAVFFENYKDIQKNYPKKFLNKIVDLFNKDSIYRVHGTTSKDAATSILKNGLNIYAENPTLDHTSLNIGYQNQKKLLEILLNYEHKGPLKHLIIIDAKDENIIIKENEHGKEFGNIPPQFIKGYIDVENKKVHYNKEWQGECINQKAEQNTQLFSLVEEKDNNKNLILESLIERVSDKRIDKVYDLEDYNKNHMNELLSDQRGFLESIDRGYCETEKSDLVFKEFKNRRETFSEYLNSPEYNKTLNNLETKEYKKISPSNEKHSSNQKNQGLSLDKADNLF